MKSLVSSEFLYGKKMGNLGICNKFGHIHMDIYYYIRKNILMGQSVSYYILTSYFLKDDHRIDSFTGNVIRDSINYPVCKITMRQLNILTHIPIYEIKK